MVVCDLLVTPDTAFGGMRHSERLRRAVAVTALLTITKNRAARTRFLVMVGEAGFGPAKSVTTDLQSAPFGRSGIPPYKLELVNGVEPSTC